MIRRATFIAVLALTLADGSQSSQPQGSAPETVPVACLEGDAFVGVGFLQGSRRCVEQPDAEERIGAHRLFVGGRIGAAHDCPGLAYLG